MPGRIHETGRRASGRGRGWLAFLYLRKTVAEREYGRENYFMGVL